MASTAHGGHSYIKKCIETLDRLSLLWKPLHTLEDVEELSPTTVKTKFNGYRNDQAGWADALKAISVLRDQCIEAGISFLSGSSDTVMSLIKDPASGKVQGATMKSGDTVHGDFFILATGAWTSRLVSMYNTVLATAQVLGYLKLSKLEMEKYRRLPIYINSDTGWFYFAPHLDTGYLKVAVHGWGYTRALQDRSKEPGLALSSPPIAPRNRRANFTPADGTERLSEGFLNILPELATRPFDRTAVCWYTDTPTGDFIVDHHPDFDNVFLATGGSGFCAGWE